MHYTPCSELGRRVTRLQSAMVASDIDCVLIRQNVNLYYFAGTIQNAHLFIPASGRPVLLVRRDLMRARLDSALDIVVPFRSFREIPGLLKENGIGSCETIGLELDALPASFYLTYVDLFARSRLVNVSALIGRIRAIKSEWEVCRIEEAARQADLMYRTVRGMLREGVTEIELAAEAEKAARINGHQGLLRTRAWNTEIVYGNLAAGLSAAVAGHLDGASGGVGISPALGKSAGYRKVGSGEVVYVDLTGCSDGYLADQTRNLVLGPPSVVISNAYSAMREVYAQLFDMVRPGIRAGDIYAKANQLATAAGFGDQFMGSGMSKVVFVGHGVGLELDELPPLARGIDTLIEAGMVLALEPKLIIPGVGAIGMENTHLVTEAGLRKLTFSDEELVVV